MVWVYLEKTLNCSNPPWFPLPIYMSIQKLEANSFTENSIKKMFNKHFWSCCWWKTCEAKNSQVRKSQMDYTTSPPGEMRKSIKMVRYGLQAEMGLDSSKFLHRTLQHKVYYSYVQLKKYLFLLNAKNNTKWYSWDKPKYIKLSEQIRTKKHFFPNYKARIMITAKS